MSYSCHICGKYFSKPFNLRRHKRKVHDQKPTDSIRMATDGCAVLQHPFTCIVAGCTQSGKTVWVKSLLENVQKTISPLPQRIIWCFGQWQRSYFDMMRTMPGIEFN
jgi:type IV secretory pathway VirB4 component